MFGLDRSNLRAYGVRELIPALGPQALAPEGEQQALEP